MRILIQMGVIIFSFAAAPSFAQSYTCVDGKAVRLGSATNNSFFQQKFLHERQNEICEIEEQGEIIGKRMTGQNGILPGAEFGIIAKPHEYRTTLDYNIALGAGQCGWVRVIVRYLDGGVPRTMRVWVTENFQNKDLHRGPGNDVTVKYCPVSIGLTRFRVSAGEPNRPVIALAKPK